MTQTQDGKAPVSTTSRIESSQRRQHGFGCEVDYQQLKQRVHQKLVESLDLAAIERVDDPLVQNEVSRLTWNVINSESEGLAEDARACLFDDLQDELFRHGPLEPALADPTVSDILVNGPREVFIERFGRLEKTDIVFADQAHLLRIIQRIVSAVGRRLDRSTPLVDARLPDGSRVNAVIPPLTLNGPKLSIRRFVTSNFDLDVLVSNGSLSAEMATFLQATVEARISVLFSGGAGAGKTTMLSALSHSIPCDERLVTIEDSAELVLQHPHVVRMETRPANQDGAGAYTVRDLVRNSLRMRPDRIIIGEVRGAETVDMIQAMNTGHEGSMTTVHANGARDALARLELMVAMARVDLPPATVREFIVLGIPLVVHLARLKGGVRKVTSISELVSVDRQIKVVDIFRYVADGLGNDGESIGHFEATNYRPTFMNRFKLRGITVHESLFSTRVQEGA